MNRRGFISMLPMVTIASIAPALIFLPPKGAGRQDEEFADYCKRYGHGDFNTENMRYKAHERWSSIYGDAGDGVSLSEASLERVCLEIAGMENRPDLTVRHLDRRYFTDPNQWYLKT